MAASEFDLIERYFARQAVMRPDVPLGIGDDCALLAAPPGRLLAVSIDMLVAGVHFFADADPEGIGHKALAVNLSDLAAAGAEPAWVTLALALPAPDDAWLARFCAGFFGLAARHGVQLVGGDTTRGPLTIAVQAHGFVDPAQALRRDGARVGDAVFVTGTPGDAGLALAAARNEVAIADLDQRRYLDARLQRPTPRLRQGRDLAGLASAAIDVSDGLAQDLSHILKRSGVGARLWVERLPLSAALADDLDRPAAIALALGGGDDYELCFTVPPVRISQLQELAAGWDCACTEIGVIEATPGLRLTWGDGTPFPLARAGYDHFG